MSGIAAKWVVQRYEQPGIETMQGRVNMKAEGYEQVCEDWREACEAVTLAIGPNALQFGVEPTTAQPVVFERDGVVVIVYMKLEI
jgi:hypothetical protein